MKRHRDAFDSESDEPEPMKRGRTSSTDSYRLDTFPLISHLVKCLSKLPIDKHRLESVVSEAVNSARETLVEEYCAAKPADLSWKVGLPTSTVSRLEPTLRRLRELQKSQEITVDRILSSKLTDVDKLKAIELHDILQNVEPYTEDHQRIRLQLSQLVTSEKSEREEELDKLCSVSRVDEIRDKILKLDAPDAVVAVIWGKYRHFQLMDKESTTYATAYSWLDWAVSLPWNRSSPKLTFSPSSPLRDHLVDIRKKLDSAVYGMEHVKDRLIAHYCARLRGSKSAIIALKGREGVGKTTIVSAYAAAIGVPFQRIPMGGSIDPSLFRGSATAWVGSSPSIVCSALRQAGVCDCTILYDELDKVGEAARGGDPKASQVEATLLHITDRSQNSSIRDEFLDGLSIDVSRVDQFFTLNDEAFVNSILRDRLDFIEIKDYTPEQKVHILRNYSLPKIIRELNTKKFTLTEDGAKMILSKSGRAVGIRTVEKILRTIVGVLAYKSDVGSECVEIINGKVVNDQYAKEYEGVYDP